MLGFIGPEPEHHFFSIRRIPPLVSDDFLKSSSRVHLPSVYQTLCIATYKYLGFFSLQLITATMLIPPPLWATLEGVIKTEKQLCIKLLSF